MRRFRTYGRVTFGLVGIALSTCSGAAPLIYNFTGTITAYQYHSSFATDPFSGAIDTGMNFSGSFTYDPDESYLYTDHTNFNFYQLTQGALNTTIDVGGLSFATKDNAFGAAWVHDNLYWKNVDGIYSSGTGDYLQIVAGDGDDTAETTFPELATIPAYFSDYTYWLQYDRQSFIRITDPSGSMLTDQDLPYGLPDVTGLDATVSWVAYATYYNGDGDEVMVNLYSFEGQIGSPSLTSVPVPGAVWLFGGGLVGLIAAARRRSSDNCKV
jgi:hypothetical protein